jgi:hypothetical protein
MKSFATLALLGIYLVAGCSSIGSRATQGPTPPADVPTALVTLAASTQPDGSTRAPTVGPAEMPTVEPIPTTEPTEPRRPSPRPTFPPNCCDGEILRPPEFVPGLEASDAFWNWWFDDCFFGAFDLPSSLAQVSANADLIVRGRIVDLYIGEYWRSIGIDFRDPLAYVRVEVDEVLKGDPAWRNPGFVEVGLGHAFDAMESVRVKLPDHEHLWFLTWDGERDPINESEIAPYAYYAPDYKLPTILRNIDGKVQVINPDTLKRAYGRSQFPLPLDGTDFAGLLDKVRALGNARVSGPRAPDQLSLAAC